MKKYILLRKNTYEIREKLKAMCFDVCPCCEYYGWPWIHISEQGVHGIPRDERGIFLGEDLKDCIDCGVDEEKFIEEAKRWGMKA